MGTELWFLLGGPALVVALLAANYVAVTLQERRPGGAPPAVPPASVRWDALGDPELRRLLVDGPVIAAIKRYRDITGVGLRVATRDVEFLRDHPQLLDPPGSAPQG